MTKPILEQLQSARTIGELFVVEVIHIFEVSVERVEEAWRPQVELGERSSHFHRALFAWKATYRPSQVPPRSSLLPQQT